MDGRDRPSTGAGFALIEALTALFLLSTCILALAAAHATSLRLGQAAYLRSQAIAQVSDLTERMRANRVAASSGRYAAGPPTQYPPACQPPQISACSAHDIAAYDLYEWGRALAARLPAGVGAVTALGEDTFSVTVSWLDAHAPAASASRRSLTTTLRL